MVIFHSYVSLPEGKSGGKNLGKLGDIYIYNGDIMGICFWRRLGIWDFMDSDNAQDIGINRQGFKELCSIVTDFFFSQSMGK
jgi:hypothetical protein